MNQLPLTNGPIPQKIKDRLYPILEEIYSTTDFSKVKIQDLVEHTGMSSATMYRYYTTKEDMVFLMIQEHLEEITRRIDEYSRGILNAKEIFRRRLWVAFDYYDSHPAIAVIAFIMIPIYKWVEMGYYNLTQFEGGLDTLLKAIKDDDTLSDEIDIHIIRDFGYMILYRVVQLWYFHGKKDKMVNIFDERFDFYWKAFLK